MLQNLNKKTCLIVECLSMGGAEKMAGLLSIALKAKGYSVSIIAVNVDTVYDFSGDLFTLDVASKKKLPKQWKKLKKFRNSIRLIDADYYIDFRFRGRMLMEFMLHFFVFPKSKMIFTHHSFLKQLNRPSGSIFDYFYNKAYKNIAVSKVIKEQLPKHNSELIYNFVSVETLQVKAKEDKLMVETPYIIVVSRLIASKQIDRLIYSYSKSCLPEQNVKLLILGEGEEKDNLTSKVKELNLESKIELKGFVQNPYPYMSQALYLVQSSLYEGFPMVLIESLALGTPVIAFDCPSGPSEIITHKENGLLIENQNFQALQDAMNSLVLDKDQLATYAVNAKVYIQPFKSSNIIQQWTNLFENVN